MTQVKQRKPRKVVSDEAALAFAKAVNAAARKVKRKEYSGT